MIDDDFEDITCIDWSENAIEIQNSHANQKVDDNGEGLDPQMMSEKYQSLKFLHMDARNMSAFEGSSFDVVVD